jgi:O-antigen/teichoic acid export membrane protein
VSATPGLAVDTPRAPALAERPARWWAGKAFWSVTDQGLFAVSNFALGVLLARWLPADQFGSFAVAHSVFLLLGTLHGGLVTEPMLVFGSSRHDRRFSGYLDVLVHAHWRLTALGALLLAGVAGACWLLSAPLLAGAFLGAAVATPAMLFGWLARRACAARLQPKLAAMGGAVYLLVVLAGSYALLRAGVLAPGSALVLMGVAGVISGAWILARLRSTGPATADLAPSRHEVYREHWHYGRWSLASSGLSWVPGNVYYLLLPAFAGLEAAGAVRAVSNLVLPVLHLNAALGILLLPALSSVAADRSRFDRTVAGRTRGPRGGIARLLGAAHDLPRAGARLAV